MILYETTKDKNKVPEDDSNGTLKFHRLEISIEEDVSIFQSVVEADQGNGGPQKNRNLAEMKTIPEGQTRNRVWNNSLRDRKELNARP